MTTVKEAVELVQAAEDLGFAGMGFADTAPLLYEDVYATLMACLLGTSRIRLGTFVTNCISRHPAVHASIARTFEDIAPGRFFLGISTGDGAVHSIGLTPATWSGLEVGLNKILDAVPQNLEVHVATSGSRGASVAGRLASDVTFGIGLDVDALESLKGIAQESRRGAGNLAPLRAWGLTSVHLVEHPDEVPARKLALRGFAYSSARFAFDHNFTNKNVPEIWQEALRERFARYDFGFHGSDQLENPNSRLFEDIPAIEDYLVDRMLVVGTPGECARRIIDVGQAAALEGFWIGLAGGVGQTRLDALKSISAALSVS